MSFNKNCNNQSSLQADTLQANLNLIAPLPTLPSTNDYLNTLTSNNIGYTINGTPNNIYVTAFTTTFTTNIYSLTLPIGIWNVIGQLDYFSNDSMNVSYTEITTQLTTNNFNKNNSGTILSGNNIINQVHGIYTVTSPLTINLSGTIIFSTGIILTKINNSSTTAISNVVSNSNIILVNPNINIKAGMVVTGTGVNQPCRVLSNTSGNTLITISSNQTISGGVVLTFTLTKGSSFLTATRIG
jgi:hypothetical protein